MVSREIEKEIDQENKILMGCTLRQLICIAIVCILSFVSAAVLGWNVKLAMYPVLLFGLLGYLFGWYKPNGETFEQFLMKYIRNHLYHGNYRHYKTKNQYVTMMNEEYKRRANIDNSDKKVVKAMKKASKKKKQKSLYQPIK